MRAHHLPDVLVAAVLLVGACAPQAPSLGELPASEMAGHYTGGTIGESWFRPCGASPADSASWVTFTGDAVAQVERARSSGRLVPGTRYFVRWTAAVTTSGQVGPRGPGVPAYLVRNVLELRPPTDTDCAAGQPTR